MGNVIGRSDRVRQTKVFLELIAIVYIIRKWRTADPDTWVGKLDAALFGWRPWQIVLASLGVSHLMNNISVVLGLNAPHRSLRSGPELRYSPSFSRVRWLFTALDAGVLSAARIRWPLLRDTVSIALGAYYMLFSSKAETKVQQFQSQITPALVKRMWEKGAHPLLRAVTALQTPRIGIPGKELTLPRADGTGIRCVLYYHGTEAELAKEDKLTLNFPGGGFIAMPPQFHTDYLTLIALRTRTPILSVDYRKAIHHPYPAQLLDCFDVYKAITDTAGAAVGVNLVQSETSPTSAPAPASATAPAPATAKPLKLVVFGDSAGGNLSCAVVLRAVILGMPLPCGLHLIYPILDMTSRFWKPQTHIKLQPSNTNNKNNNNNTASSSSKTDSGNGSTYVVIPPAPPGSASDTFATALAANGASSDPITTLRPPEMTSRARFSGDAVLPFRYLLVIGQSLFRGGGDPTGDMYCSPLLAPDALLARFPPTFMHVGGVDPLCDDAVNLGERLKRANPAIPVKVDVIPGVSHAYMNVASLLPEGQYALGRTVEWIQEFQNLATTRTSEYSALTGNGDAAGVSAGGILPLLTTSSAANAISSGANALTHGLGHNGSGSGSGALPSAYLGAPPAATTAAASAGSAGARLTALRQLQRENVSALTQWPGMDDWQAYQHHLKTQNYVNAQQQQQQHSPSDARLVTAVRSGVSHGNYSSGSSGNHSVGVSGCSGSVSGCSASVNGCSGSGCDGRATTHSASAAVTAAAAAVAATERQTTAAAVLAAKAEIEAETNAGADAENVIETSDTATAIETTDEVTGSLITAAKL